MCVPGPERPCAECSALGAAVARLIGQDALTGRQRLTLAALLTVVGQLDMPTLNPAVGVAYSITVEALTDRVPVPLRCYSDGH